MTDEEIAKLTEGLEEAVVQLVLEEANHGAINLADSCVRKAVVASLAKASWTFECDDEEWGEV